MTAGVLRRTRGFTLVELLVVIGIIALLISILLPSLNKARQQANSAKCLSNLKQLANANVMFAAEHEGWYVPFQEGYDLNAYTPPFPPPGPIPAGYQSPAPQPFDKNRYWMAVNDFRSAFGVDPMPDKAQSGIYAHYNNDAQYRYSAEAVCPNASQLRPGALTPPNQFGYYMPRSYGMNTTNMPRLWNRKGYPIQWKSSQVISPASKIMFIDTNDIWANINSAGKWEFYQEQYFGPATPGAVNAYGTVNYRHNEGANMVFYDGHAEWKNKYEVYDKSVPYGTDSYMGYDKLWQTNKRFE